MSSTPTKFSGLQFAPRFPLGALVSFCLALAVFVALLAVAGTGVGLIGW